MSILFCTSLYASEVEASVFCVSFTEAPTDASTLAASAVAVPLVPSMTCKLTWSRLVRVEALVVMDAHNRNASLLAAQVLVLFL